MRVTNSIKNTIAVFIVNIVVIIVGLISQRVFVNTLGLAYLGLNGLFTNIISMLAIAELGIGTAITYNLYAPIANNDKEKIKSLMQFYKKCYSAIVVIIFSIGIAIMPFLNSIVGKVDINYNIYIIFILFIIDTICSYLLVYKRSILYANQMNYIVNIVHVISLVILNAIQIIILVLTQNYILYLIIKIIFRLIENVVINYIANKKYPYIKESNIKNLDKNVLTDIKRKVKALVLHRVAGFVVLGTDNIIISKFFGVVYVGLYANYYLIISSVGNLISQFFTSITASVGNLLVEENNEKAYSIYNKILFLNFWIFGFASASIFCMIDPFIKLWIGEQYILSKFILATLVGNFYIQGMRQTISLYKAAAGIYYEDRYIPLLEALINIVASILFMTFFGLAGVFIGTIISTLLLYLYSYPKYVYIKLFNRSHISYVKKFIMQLFIAFIIVIITYYATNIFYFDSIILKLIYNLICCLIIPNLILFLLMHKTDEFIYYKNMFYNAINKFKYKMNK